MSTNAKKPETTALAVPTDGLTPEQEQALTKRDDAVLFVSLMQGKSKQVENNEPKGIRQGDYLLGGRTRIPAFREGDGFVCVFSENGSRPAAVLFENDKKIEDSHDEKSPEWARVQAAKKSSHKGAKIGIEMLAWLPEHDTFGVLSFMNTSKSEAKDAFACRAAKQIARVTSKQVGKNSTFVPSVAPAKDQSMIPMPSPERVASARAWFFAYLKEKPAAPAKEGARPR